MCADNNETVFQSLSALASHWRAVSAVSSFINHLAVFVGEIDDVIHGFAEPPIFLRSLDYYVESVRVIAKKTAGFRETVFEA